MFVEALAYSPSGSDDDSGFGPSPLTPPASPRAAAAAAAAEVTAAATAAAPTVTPPPAVFKQGHYTPAPLGAPVGPRRPYPPLSHDPNTQGSHSCGCTTFTNTTGVAAAAVCPTDAHGCSSDVCPPPHSAPPPPPLWDDRDVRAVERTASAWMRSALATGATTAALLRLDGGAPFAAGVAVAAAAAVGVGAWRRSVNAAAVCKWEVRPAGWVVWGLAVGGGVLVLAGGLVIGGVAA